MATQTTRGARPSLPSLLVLLLALIAGLAVPPLAVEQAGPRPAASAVVTSPGDAAVQAGAATTTEPPAVPVEAVHCDPVAGRMRVLCPQLVVAVRAARAPPAATA